MVCIQRPEYGGGEIWFDGKLIRKDGLFVPKALQKLNPDYLLGSRVSSGSRGPARKDLRASPLILSLAAPASRRQPANFAGELLHCSVTAPAGPAPTKCWRGRFPTHSRAALQRAFAAGLGAAQRSQHRPGARR